MWFGAEQARETDPVEPARRQARILLDAFSGHAGL
jgi:hypothetical protein